VKNGHFGKKLQVKNGHFGGKLQKQKLKALALSLFF